MKKSLCLLFTLFIISSLSATNIQVITKKGTAKDSSIIYNEGVLTLDHIYSPLIDINLNNTKVNKLICNFVNFSDESESFWNRLENLSEVEFNFCTLNNFDFLKSLKDVKVVCFIESNTINDYSHIDFSNNKRLEELILSNYEVTNLNIVSDFVPKLKYFYVAYANCDLSSYDNLKRRILPETLFIIDSEQEQYFKGCYYILSDKFDLWNRKIKE